MPLESKEILSHFVAGKKAGRLAHTFLFTATRPEALQALILDLAKQLLGEEPEDHPDFFRVRPESKSRRITVEQVRVVEKSLYMKPFKAPYKVAWIEEADRMCIGQAEPANAFLKTLEEPPASTLILLTSTRPQMLLPTIISRCIKLDLLEAEAAPINPELETLWKQWSGFQTPGALRAYGRARLLNEYWAQIHDGLEETVTEQFGDVEEGEEEIVKAAIEGEFQLARQQSIANLQSRYWEGVQNALEEPNLLEKLQAIKALEELHQTLQQNMDQNLVVDRACLAIEGLI